MMEGACAASASTNGHESPEAPKPSTSPRMLVIGDLCSAKMQSESWDLKRFQFLRVIGRGYASWVYQAIDNVTGMTVAVKVYQKADLCPLNFHQIKREILIHSSFKHPNILPMYCAFDDADNIYMVLEFAAKGDLYNYLRHKGRTLTEVQTAKYVIAPFLSTLKYIHANDVIHRDIKPENMLLTSSGTLKLSDFGLSIMHSDEQPVTYVGTLDYMAPEVVRCPRKQVHTEPKNRSELVYGPKADVWAVGVLVYELITCRPPFQGPTKEATQASILSGNAHMPDLLSDLCKDFVRACLTKDAKARPSVNELLHHPWIAPYMSAESAAAPAPVAPHESAPQRSASSVASFCSNESRSHPGVSRSGCLHQCQCRTWERSIGHQLTCGGPAPCDAVAAHGKLKRKLSARSPCSSEMHSLCATATLHGAMAPQPSLSIAAHYGSPTPPANATGNA